MRIIQKTISWAVIVCITHNPIAASYILTGLIFFKPFPAYADAFLDEAAQGSIDGTSFRKGYSIPIVDSTTGQMTFTNGKATGETMQQGELFQEIQPGSMDGIATSYGDAATFGTHINNNLSSLSSGTSTHAEAYQTLMGANTAMPNMMNDPIWKTSDDVFSLTSPLINNEFSGCQKNTNFSETSCPLHIPDIRECTKTLKTESCKVERIITPVVSEVIKKVSGGGNFSINGSTGGMTMVAAGGGGACPYASSTMTVNVVAPDFLKEVLIYQYMGDSNGALYIDNVKVFDTGGCADMPTGVYPANKDITSYLKTPGTHTIKIVGNSTSAGNESITMNMSIKLLPTFTEEFIDFPAGCRQRLFDTWPPSTTPPPPFISSGSPNDEASTDWWQCTDAADTRSFGTLTITAAEFGGIMKPILPEPKASPPAPICYKAETRLPGHITLPCFTDKDGYQVCPQYDYNLAEHTSCDTLSSNPQCVYIGEKCADNMVDPVTGVCGAFVISYDCGVDEDASCDLVNNSEKTICDSKIRCMGGECVDQANESSKDFIKAATALQTLNQAQQGSTCDPATGECVLFAGEPMECQMADMSVLGSVDCCNMPIQGSWIEYMDLAYNTWELADTSVQAYSIANNGLLLTEQVGAWNMVSSGSVFSTPIGAMTDAWTSITEPFTSMYDSVASMLGEQLGPGLGIEAIKQQVVQWMGEWIASTFGETAASTLLTATTSTAGSVATTTYSMAGSMLSSIITVVGIIYAIYQIAKMVVQLVFACTEDEIKLNMLKQQRLCTETGEIGQYCSSSSFMGCVARKEAYCCFSSPFARIFQQQARPQLGLTFGDPKLPICEGLSITQISKLDFDKMNFNEWINMLKGSDHLPKNATVADSMYDKANITKGKLPNTQNQNAQDRINSQTNGSNIDAIRQHLLDNL